MTAKERSFHFCLGREFCEDMMFGDTAVHAHRGNVRMQTESEPHCCSSQVQKQPGRLSFRLLEVKQTPLDAYIAFGQGILSCASAIL